MGSTSWSPVAGLLLVGVLLESAASAKWNHARPDELIQTNIRDCGVEPLHGILWACALRGDAAVPQEYVYIVLKSYDSGVTWDEVYSEPAIGGTYLSHLCVQADGRCWVIPQDGVPRILLTADGGATWFGIDLSDFGIDHLDDMDFVDPLHGWLAATCHGAPVVLATSDGGYVWSLQASLSFPPAGKMCQVDFLDPLVGWAGARTDDGCSVYATSDGGMNWALESHIAVAPGLELMDLFCLDLQHAWAMVIDPTNLLTSVYHRGPAAAWGLLSVVPYGLGCQEMRFSSPQEGFLLSYLPFTMKSPYLLTHDGGLTWEPYWFPSAGMYIDSFAVGSGGEVWAAGSGVVGGGGCLLRSHDSLGWEVLRWSDYLIAVGVPGMLDGWAVGANGCILRTRDRGESWQLESIDGRYPQWIGTAAFTDETHGYLVDYETDGHFYLMTTDGIGAWWAVSDLSFLLAFSHPLSLAFPTPELGFLGEHYLGGPGDPARLYRSEDGGLNWELCFAHSDVGGVRSLCFVSPDTGWAVASQSEVHRTTDGGLTWESYPVAPFGVCLFPEVVRFIDDQQGWLLCAFSNVSAEIWHSGDGGQTWQKRADFGGTTSGFSDIFFTSSTNGWLSEKMGRIRYTRDGGFTWAPDSPEEDPHFVNRIYFQDDTYGWAVGGDDILFHSHPTAVQHDVGDWPRPATTYPNPFRDRTSIRFAMPAGADRTQLRVYDARGRVVWEADHSGAQIAGDGGVVWTGRMQNGAYAPSGIYLFEVQVDGVRYSGKGLLSR